jgi:hypothetical protein
MNEPSESFVASEQVTKRVVQVARRNRIVRGISDVLFLLGGFLVLLSSIAVLSRSPNTVGLLAVGGVGLMLAAIGIIMVLRKLYATSLRQLVRMVRLERTLESLQKQHPELIVLQEALRLVDEEKEEASSRRGFWASAGQNFFFLLLGIIITYALTRLGWLR